MVVLNGVVVEIEPKFSLEFTGAVESSFRGRGGEWVAREIGGQFVGD